MVLSTPTKQPDDTSTAASLSFARSVLECALRVTGTDLGNVQLVDPDTGALRIVAHAGFGNEFLEYFAVVDDAHSACGRAAQQARQVVVRDVSTDAGFRPHREIASSSRFRSVQSTPLIDQRGTLVGMVSTHFKEPNGVSEFDLQLATFTARVAGAMLGPQMRSPAVIDGPDWISLEAIQSLLLFQKAASSDDRKRYQRPEILESTNDAVSRLHELGFFLASMQNRAEDEELAKRLRRAITELDRVAVEVRRNGMDMMTSWVDHASKRSDDADRDERVAPPG
jgi:uncharacterized membrane protein YfbV (UPF0208 family)